MKARRNIFVRCSYPPCNNNCGQHSKKLNTNKQVCNAHRTRLKHEIDYWKITSGCANKDGHYGFACVCRRNAKLHPATLDINHINGNNLDRDPSNIEILCKMCHMTASLNQNHHLNQPKLKRGMKVNLSDLFTISDQIH